MGTPTVADVTEDATAPNLTATGSISISDTDTGEGHFQSTVSSAIGNLGSLALNSDGSYTYPMANSAVQYLAGSNANGGTSTKVETFTIHSADGTSQYMSFTITGIYAPSLHDALPISDVTEDATAPNLTATGSISISDTDTGEGHFQSTVSSAIGNLGSLALN